MKYEVQHNATTVWVNAEDGSCIGRFSKRFGMDVHHSLTAQLEGKPQCLHCTHVPGTETDWHLFRGLMYGHHGVEIPAHLLVYP